MPEVITRKRKKRTQKPERAAVRPPMDPAKLNGYLLMALAVASVFQVYFFHVGQLGVSLCLAVAAVVAFRVNWGAALRLKLFWLVLALFALQWISLSWAVNPDYAWPDLANTFIYIVALGAGLTIGQVSARQGLGILQLICVTGLVVAAAIIVMRLMPDTRRMFLESGAADFFINPYRLHRFLFSGAMDTMGGTNNALNADKSGAVFLNANVGGAWCAVMAFLTLACFNKEKGLVRLAIAAVYVAGVAASGSKGSVLILLASPIAFGVVMALRSVRVVKVMNYRNLVLATGGVALLLGLWFFQDPILSIIANRSDLLTETINTSQCRTDLLNHAWSEFLAQPLQGHGYGGWYQSFDVAGDSECLRGDVPPLNAIILLWTQNGLIAALAGVAIVAMTVYTFARLLKGDYARFAFFSGCAYLSLVFQSLGEDLGLFEDAHISVPIALALGLSLSVKRVKKLKHAGASGTELLAD